jgi:glycerol-3-phosphate dehydrogenase
MSRIFILGSGAWGTALALSLDRRGGHQVTLWAHSPEEAQRIAAAGENSLFLPGFPMPPEIEITGDESAARDAEILLSVVPSEFLRSTIARFRPHLHPGQIVVSATKGVEDSTFLRMTQVIAEALAAPMPQAGSEREAALRSSPGTASPAGEEHPALKGRDFSGANDAAGERRALAPEGRFLDVIPETRQASSAAPVQSQPRQEGCGDFTPAVDAAFQSEIGLFSRSKPAPANPRAIPVGAFSGPSFALEVAQGQPTAITVAFEDPAVAARIQQEFCSETLRLYTSTDVIGVELGGALKNVIAIAAGIAAGIGLGHNSAAGLMTRGIAEITRLAVACGGRRETLAGLSGVGDLVLTCTGSLSRNRTVGEALGHGRKLPEILESLGGKVAEGVRTTRAALGLARLHRIEMPITEQMEQILENGKDPREAIKDLMLRPGKEEH